jgi:Transglycosylase SLT domain
VFPRISTSSPLKNIYRNPTRLTFAVAAATLGVCAAVTSGVAAGSAGTASAATMPTAAVSAGPVSGPPLAVSGTHLVTGHSRIHTVAVRREAGQAARRSAGQHQARHLRHAVRQHAARRTARHHAARSSPCHSSELHWWICHAEQVMVQHGTPQSAISTPAAFIVVLNESGGNPRAFNGWDSNAAAGTPSEGIAQVIGPTFSTYALPGHHNIWNPVDNMIAAFRYAISRYGSMNNIPGVVAVHSGGSYVGY